MWLRARVERSLLPSFRAFPLLFSPIISEFKIWVVAARLKWQGGARAAWRVYECARAQARMGLTVATAPPSLLVLWLYPIKSHDPKGLARPRL